MCFEQKEVKEKKERERRKEEEKGKGKEILEQKKCLGNFLKTCA